jgi:NAD-dependent deacetylase
MWENPEARALARKSGSPWNTKGTWEFYEWRRKLVANCEPNAAHKTLADMEAYFDDFQLITQNVDGLHLRAGNSKVLELHGNMWKGRCPKDGAIVDLPTTPLPRVPPVHQYCGTALRPHVVQFGEPLDPEILGAAIQASRRAELLLVIGTSAVVYPAAEMPLIALQAGAVVIEINREPTGLTPLVTLALQGKAAEILPQLWKTLRS